MKKKTILIAGAGGLIGSALAERFQEQMVHKVGRQEFRKTGAAFVREYESADVIMNFSGSPVVKRWTKKNREEILESRIETTQKLGMIIEKGRKKQRRYITASAVGIYGEKGIHTEDNYRRGEGFMAEVVGQWEKEAMKLKSELCSVVILRLGVVLSPDGGMMARMLPYFRMGLGGRIGNGQQAFSWIHLKDLLGVVEFILMEDAREGIYNAVSPGGCRNIDFTRQLGKAVHRPTPFRIPLAALKLIYGEGAAAVSKGQMVIPKRLISEGFEFRYPDIDSALRDVVN